MTRWSAQPSPAQFPRQAASVIRIRFGTPLDGIRPDHGRSDRPTGSNEIGDPSKGRPVPVVPRTTFGVGVRDSLVPPWTPLGVWEVVLRLAAPRAE